MDLRSSPEKRHVALAGPTASGKSALAMELARCHREAELVYVDSMCVYRGMDIGTAKPTRADRAVVRHHLLDLVDPHEDFTVGDFQRAARQALAEIEARGHRALLVAGTGLYLRAVVDNLDIPGRWPEVTGDLEEEAEEPGGLTRLHSRLESLDPLAASRIEPGNKRRIVRALEVTIGSGRRFSSFGPGLGCYAPTRFVLIGTRFTPEVQDARIEARLESMLESGFVEEVRRLAASTDGISRTARQALGYRELLAHVEDGLPLGEAVSETLRRTKAFARRQMSWFRRDPRITWLVAGDDPLLQLNDVWDTAGTEAVED